MDCVDIINEEEAEKTSISHRKRIVIIIVAAIFLMVVLCVTGLIKNNNDASLFTRGGQSVPEQKLPVEIIETAPETTEEPDTEIDAEEIRAKEIEYAAPHNYEDAILSTEAVKLSDIYVVSESTVQMKCYYPEAESYMWEVYDRHKCTWEIIDSEMLQDELYRPVSILHVAVEGTDTTMVRCTIQMKNGESLTENASVYIIPDIQDISIKEEYITDAGKYISSSEIPINVSYADGTQDIITGLYGVVFVESTENRELSTSGTGNHMEIITTAYTECDYAYIGLEDKKLLLRYRCESKEQTIDTELIVLGKDLTAPVISAVSVSGFEITNVDTSVLASISIIAEDDKTPYPDLEYAFIPKNTESDTMPNDDDWIREAVFDLDITRNGTWIAFCRDRSGNIAEMEKEIIVVDQKAPIISVILADTGWCTSTQMVIDAEDYLPVQYKILSPDGTDSGWTTKNEYEVNCNGTWEVQARDSVGNVSMKKIVVSNIDKQSPVIENITVKKVVETEGDRDED